MTSTFVNINLNILKQNWNQFLIVVKVTALKQQVSKFYPQILSIYVSDHMYVRQWPVINVILCLEFARRKCLYCTVLYACIILQQMKYLIMFQ